ncbi:MarR family winged helix-turn-helix transcriptional regulator [Thermodesulfobacteriota bacterium]
MAQKKENNSSVVDPRPGVSLQDEEFKQEFVDEAVQDSIRWIVWYLRRLVQADEMFNKELYKKHAVSQPQLTCLLALHEYGPLHTSKLAKYIMVKPSTATGIVDRLEEKGLVVRQRSMLDRRVVTIELTESGQALAEDAPIPIPKRMVDGLNKLHVDETKKIVKSLAALVAMLDEPTV